MPTSIKGRVLNTDKEYYNVWSFNNNYYTFKPTQVTVDGVELTVKQISDFAEVTYNEIKYTLYPDAEGVFTFNTYEFSRELFDYKDNFDYNLNTVDLNQMQAISFNIDIYLKFVPEPNNIQNQTLNVNFYNGSSQRWESPDALDYNDGIERLPYFEGYPFDYSVATDTEVTRTLPTDLSLFDVKSHCEGYYIKYHDGKYGYKYYLFRPIGKGKYTTSSYGDIKEQFSWTNNTLELGKKGKRTIDLFDIIPYEYREMMYLLAESNEVYLYTGTPDDFALRRRIGIGIDVIGQTPIGYQGDEYNAINISDYFLEVKVKLKVEETNNFNAFEQSLQIILPESQTRTRI